MRFAAIKNNVVVGVGEATTLPSIAFVDSVMDVGTIPVQVGWIWTGTALIPPPTPVDGQMTEVTRSYYVQARTERDRDYTGMTVALAVQALVPAVKLAFRLIILIARRQNIDTNAADGDL